MISISDDIIVGLKQGNESATLIVFSKYKYYAKGYYTGKYGMEFGLHHWEDVVQECFITLSKNAHKFRGTSKQELESFVRTMFRNSITRYMESFIKSASLIVDLSGTDNRDPLEGMPDICSGNLEEDVLNRLTVNSMFKEKVFPVLTKDEREMFRAIVSDKDMAPIAASFDISMDAARQRKCRLIKKIRDLLKAPETAIV